MPVVTAHGEIEAELIVGRLRDEGLDARVVRDGKQSPGAWMYAGHDPFEAMTVVVPEDDAEAARRVLELPDDPVVPTTTSSRPAFRVVLVTLVAVVLVVALLQAQLVDVLPFLGEP